MDMNSKSDKNVLFSVAIELLNILKSNLLEITEEPKMKYLQFDEFGSVKEMLDSLEYNPFPNLTEWMFSSLQDKTTDFDLFEAFVDIPQKQMALELFNSHFKHRYRTLIAFSSEEDEEGSDFVLFCFYMSILQEYMESIGGWRKLIQEETNEDLLLGKFEKHIRFLQSTMQTIKIIIPLNGLIRRDYNHPTNLYKLRDGMVFRRLTPEEQYGKVHEGLDNSFIRNTRPYYDDLILKWSNMAIEIEQDIDTNGSDIDEIEERIEKVYQDAFKKVNSLANIISLKFNHNLLLIEDAYFIIEGFSFNMGSKSLIKWHRIPDRSSQTVKLYTREGKFISKDNLLVVNDVEIQEVMNIFKCVFGEKDSTSNRQIEAAFLRRTRSMMDKYASEGILDAAIGIESLLNGEKDEIGFRMGLYTANLLYGQPGFEDKTKRNIFKDFKAMYATRSNIVHRGEEKNDPRGIEFLDSLLISLIYNKNIDFSSNTKLYTQIEDLYLFNEPQ